MPPKVAKAIGATAGGWADEEAVKVMKGEKGEKGGIEGRAWYANFVNASVNIAQQTNQDVKQQLKTCPNVGKFSIFNLIS